MYREYEALLKQASTMLKHASQLTPMSEQQAYDALMPVVKEFDQRQQPLRDEYDALEHQRKQVLRASRQENPFVAPKRTAEEWTKSLGSAGLGVGAGLLGSAGILGLTKKMMPNHSLGANVVSTLGAGLSLLPPVVGGVYGASKGNESYQNRVEQSKRDYEDQLERSTWDLPSAKRQHELDMQMDDLNDEYYRLPLVQYYASNFHNVPHYNM